MIFPLTLSLHATAVFWVLKEGIDVIQWSFGSPFTRKLTRIPDTSITTGLAVLSVRPENKSFGDCCTVEFIGVHEFSLLGMFGDGWIRK